MMAVVQVRRPSAGQAYYRRKLAEGKSPKEALRCLKRRLSDAVYRCLLADQLAVRPGDSGVPPVTFSERSEAILAPQALDGT
jgi:transposase